MKKKLIALTLNGLERAFTFFEKIGLKAIDAKNSGEMSTTMELIKLRITATSMRIINDFTEFLLRRY